MGKDDRAGKPARSCFAVAGAAGRLLGAGLLVLGIYFAYRGGYLPGSHDAARLSPEMTLQVSGLKTGRVLWEQPVAPGEWFSIEFMHSVARTPVRETFVLKDDGRIALVETVYFSLGAGLPFEAHGEEQFTIGDGRMRITGFNRVFPEIILGVGRIARHTLIYRGKALPLARLAAPGTSLRIAVIVSK